MLTLHGFAYSNYYNIVKHVIMHKEIPFEEHLVYPNTPEMLEVNPTGKVPAMTTEAGTSLAESSVLTEYLEEAYPDTALLPDDIEARGKVRLLMKVSELYLELAARRLLPSLLGNTPVPDSTRKEVLSTLDRGTRSLSALTNFSPYALGAELTLADIYLRYALSIVKMVDQSLLGRNVLEEVPGLAQWDEMMSQSDIAKKIDADQEANRAPFMAFIAASFKR